MTRSVGIGSTLAQARFVALAIVILAMMAGCSGVPVTTGQSKKEEGYSEKLQRVLIVRNLYLYGMSEVNLNGLVQFDEIRTAFNEKIAIPYGLKADYLDITRYKKDAGDAQGKAAVAQAISTFHPTHVLELRTSAAKANPGLISYTIDVSVFDTGIRKVVWRGLFTVNNMAGRLIRAGDRLAPSHQDEANSFVEALKVQLNLAGLL